MNFCGSFARRNVKGELSVTVSIFSAHYYCHHRLCFVLCGGLCRRAFGGYMSELLSRNTVGVLCCGVMPAYNPTRVCSSCVIPSTRLTAGLVEDLSRGVC